MSKNRIVLSAVIIARNEEKRIRDCIYHLKFADEIIVVDNASTDSTSAEASSAGAKVIYTNERNFSKLREIGIQQTSGDWILYIDADEKVSATLEREILDIVHVMDLSKQPTAFRIKRINYYLGTLWPSTDRVERLFQRRGLKGWYGPVHESPRIEGQVAELKNTIEHDTHRSLEEMLAKTNEWSEIEAELRKNVHHPKITWWRLIRVMLTGFWESYVRERGWKVGTVGFIESMYQAYSMFITYAKLWERQRK